MEEETIRKICNKNKLIILDKIMELKKCNISQLSKKTNIDYKNLTRYIKEFERKGIVRLNKQGQGKPSIINLK